MRQKVCCVLWARNSVQQQFKMVAKACVVLSRDFFLSKVLSVLLCGLLCSGVACGEVESLITGMFPGEDGQKEKKTEQVIILSTTPTDVEYENNAAELSRIPLSDIVEISFIDEPPNLAAAREFLENGLPDEARKQFEEISDDEWSGLPEEVLVEKQFVFAAFAGRLAIESGDNLVEADKLLSEFLAANPRSYHFYEIENIYGTLKFKEGDYAAAMQAFGVLSKGPSSYKIQALNGKGEILIKQRKFVEAISEYDAALSVSANDTTSLKRKQEAALGKARALSGLVKHDDALKLVKSTINASNPDDKSFLSRAYVVLGEVYRAVQGREQEALVAYLTVDLVYNVAPESHAEALYYLSNLWAIARQEERSRQAGQILKDAYPQSEWAKKLVQEEKKS